MNLLSNLLKLTLYFYGSLRSLRIVRLGTDGIDLPMDFLEEKIHLPTDRLSAHEKGSKLGQVTLRTNHLFRDVGPFQPVSDLLLEPARVQVQTIVIDSATRPTEN